MESKGSAFGGGPGGKADREILGKASWWVQGKALAFLDAVDP
jgi:hypothetical protein